jgi:hypothetical protein
VVVPIVAAVAELAMAQREMNHEEEHHDVVAGDWLQAEVEEAGAQVLLELQTGSQGLDPTEAALGGEGLDLEARGGNLMQAGSGFLRGPEASRAFFVMQPEGSHSVRECRASHSWGPPDSRANKGEREMNLC